MAETHHMLSNTQRIQTRKAFKTYEFLSPKKPRTTQLKLRDFYETEMYKKRNYYYHKIAWLLAQTFTLCCSYGKKKMPV